MLDICAEKYFASEDLIIWLQIALSGIARTLETIAVYEGTDTPTVYACDTASVALFGISNTLENVQILNEKTETLENATETENAENVIPLHS